MILYLILQNTVLEGNTHRNTLLANHVILELISKIRSLSRNYRELCKGVLIAYLMRHNEGLIFHRRLESIYIRDCMNSITIHINFSHLIKNTLMTSLIEDTHRIEGVTCDDDVSLSYRLLRPFEGARCRVSFAVIPMPKRDAINQILREHGFLGKQQEVIYIKSYLLFITGDEVNLVRLNIAILHFKLNGDHKRIFYGEIVMPLNDHSLDLVVFTRKLCCDE